MNRQGFSLIEILMGFALIAIIFGIVGATLLSSMSGARKAGSIALAQEEGAYAIKLISDAVRFSKQVTCTTSSQLTVVKTPGDTVIYTYVNNVSAQKITRRIGATTINLTSDAVKVTVPTTECGSAMFACSIDNRKVTICFAVDNAQGIDVTDLAGIGGVMFKTQVVVSNVAN